jgi:uncharacterized protein (DUF2147 family)
MKFVTAAAVGLIALADLTPALAADPAGTWLSHNGATKVRISDCGRKLCGTVVWLDKPLDPATGQPKTDKRNPDPDKRARPLIGLTVVRGLTQSGPNEWSGAIYNADDGHVYQAHLVMQGESSARVEGCVLGVLCKGHGWTRAH